MYQKLTAWDKSFVDFLFENDDYHDVVLNVESKKSIRKEDTELPEKEKDKV